MNQNCDSLGIHIGPPTISYKIRFFAKSLTIFSCVKVAGIFAKICRKLRSRNTLLAVTIDSVAVTMLHIRSGRRDIF